MDAQEAANRITARRIALGIEPLSRPPIGALLSKPPDDERLISEIERLRSWRAPKHCDTLEIEIVAWRKLVTKRFKQSNRCIVLWEKYVEPKLVVETMLDTFVRGVLRVLVQSSPALYEVDRTLRSGIEQRMIKESHGALRRVKLTLSRWMKEEPSRMLAPHEYALQEDDYPIYVDPYHFMEGGEPLEVE